MVSESVDNTSLGRRQMRWEYQGISGSVVSEEDELGIESQGLGVVQILIKMISEILKVDRGFLTWHAVTWIDG